MKKHFLITFKRYCHSWLSEIVFAACQRGTLLVSGLDGLPQRTERRLREGEAAPGGNANTATGPPSLFFLRDLNDNTILFWYQVVSSKS